MKKSILHQHLGFVSGVFIVGILAFMSICVDSTFAQKAKGEAPKKIISLAAFPVGSQAYNWAVAVAAMIEKYTSMKVAVEPMPGTQWGELMRAGDTDLGGSNVADATDVYLGQGPWKEKGPNARIRQFAIASIDIGGISVRADRGINSIRELRGKTIYADFVPVPAVVLRPVLAFLEFYGITKNDLQIRRFNSHTEPVQAIKEGRADGMASSIAGYLMELIQATKIKYIPVPPEVVDYAIKKKGLHIVPRRTGPREVKLYDTPENMPTWGWAFVYCVRKDLNDEVVYQMLKAVYDHYHELVAVNAAAQGMKLDIALTQQMAPMHPGAIRFYKEKGMWTSENSMIDRKLLEEEAKFGK